MLLSGIGPLGEGRGLGRDESAVQHVLGRGREHRGWGPGVQVSGASALGFPARPLVQQKTLAATPVTQEYTLTWKRNRNGLVTTLAFVKQILISVFIIFLASRPAHKNDTALTS